MVEVDVAVVGIGAMGSMTLWRLAARGAHVVGFEQFEPGHDRGSSHGESRGIRTAYWEAPQYVPLLQKAFGLWRQLEEESQVQLLHMGGYLLFGRPTGPLIGGTLASGRRFGIAHELLDEREMARRYPQHRTVPGEVAVYEKEAGVLLPEIAIVTAVRRAEDLGAVVLRHTPVESIRPEPEGIIVSAGSDTYRARHVIVSVGAWLEGFLPSLAIPLEIERQVLAWFPVRNPELFTLHNFPVFVREVDGARQRYGFPTLDGKTIKLAVHHEGQATNAADIDRATHASDLLPLEDFIGQYLNGVEAAAVRTQVCMYTNSPDSHFLVGPHPILPAVTILGAFSGGGFKFASVIGDVAADLALEGGTDYPISYFAPARFPVTRRTSGLSSDAVAED